MEKMLGFKLLKETKHAGLSQTLMEFKHELTGARHIHIQSDDAENTFMVVLKTMPEDEQGVAHILEHLALCGSEKYPVRDPFFMMLRRSLNTYMNASTANDHTSYYFSSQNRKDYFNLMQVYCDAVFFPLLHPLDFAQEGHRKAINAAHGLEYRGVVYNEMKGATSDLTSQLWQRMNTLLYPNTTYRYNSGGEPRDIPNLAYDDLKAFHATFYHPSNAIFCTAGNIDVLDLQTHIHDWVLQKFSGSIATKKVPIQQAFSQRQVRSESFPAQGKGEKSSHHLRGWLLDKATDVDAWIMAKVMSYLLAGDAAAPLMHFLETTELGECPSSLTGLHAYFQQMSFVIGIEQSESSQQDQWIEQVDALLLKVRSEGFAAERVAAVFDQFELQLKDRSQSTPHGIQLLSRCVLPALHHQPMDEYLFLDEALARCQKRLSNPETLVKWIDEWLINNKHQVILTAVPDAALISERAKQVELKLAEELETLSEEARSQLQANEEALEARQRSDQDLGVLPSINRDDLSISAKPLSVSYQTSTPCSLQYFKAPTQGICFQSMTIGLPKVSMQDWSVVSVLAECLGEVGVKGCDYLAHEQKQTRYTGGIGVDLWLNGVSEGVQAYFQIETKSLNRHFAQSKEILHEIWHASEFQSVDRIRDLIAQQASDGLESIAYHGHRLAMGAAWAQLDDVGYLKDHVAGLPHFQYLNQLAQAIKAPEVTKDFLSKLRFWHDKITQGSTNARGLLVGDQFETASVDAYARQWDSQGDCIAQAISRPDPHPVVWLCDVQVNYCAKSFATVKLGHEDAPVLAVVSQILTNGFLHRVIREQGGAYGGGAVYKPMSGEFSFYSYRDPNLEKTFLAFDQSIKWFLDNEWPEHLFEEAVISLIGQLDRPDTPIGGPKRVVMNGYAGFSEEDRLVYRKQLLSIKRDMLVKVVKHHIEHAQCAGVAVIAPNSTEDQFDRSQYDVKKML